MEDHLLLFPQIDFFVHIAISSSSIHIKFSTRFVSGCLHHLQHRFLDATIRVRPIK